MVVTTFFLILKGITIASLVQKLRSFYWRSGFCLLVEMHREGSAIKPCLVLNLDCQEAAGSRSVHQFFCPVSVDLFQQSPAVLLQPAAEIVCAARNAFPWLLQHRAHALCVKSSLPGWLQTVRFQEEKREENAFLNQELFASVLGKATDLNTDWNWQTDVKPAHES